MGGGGPLAASPLLGVADAVRSHVQNTCGRFSASRDVKTVGKSWKRSLKSAGMIPPIFRESSPRFRMYLFQEVCSYAKRNAVSLSWYSQRL